MTALKIKGPQIRKISNAEVFEGHSGLAEMTKITGGDNVNGWKDLWGLIQQFVTVGGDFV
jgi:hypothetical protein